MPGFPERRHHASAEGAAMNTVTSYDETLLAYETTGEGSTLIIVDGPLCHRAAGPSAALARLLGERHTVVTYDRRGRGASSNIAPYAVEREIDDLDVLVRAAGGSAAVFGISTGGVLALDAARHGVAITRLALFEPPFIVAGPAPGALVAPLAELVTAGRRAEALDLYLSRTTGLPTDLTAGLRRMPCWWALEALAHTLVYDSMIMAGTQSGCPLPTTRWSAVAIPTLVVHGDASPAQAHAAAAALADVLPSVANRTVPGAHHQVTPTDLARVLTEFFAGKADPS
jgi:pimeloyl-ACP methyl ester carboxylesterase